MLVKEQNYNLFNFLKSKAQVVAEQVNAVKYDFSVD